MTQNTDAPAAPEVIEGPGRYIVRKAPGSDPGWIVGRAVGICERCQGCGCGEQADPISLPDFTKGQAHLMQWLVRNLNGSTMGAIRGLMKSG